MFKRLIIPLDGSPLSEAVLPTAIHLALKLQASVTLIHVIERNAPRQVHGKPHLATPQEAEPYLAEVQRRLFPSGIPVEVHVHSMAIADVAESIVEHAREFGSDLVTMCTHGRGGLRKLLFGSIAQQVAAAGVPVLLVRPVEGGSPPVPCGGPILVPLDGTEVRETLTTRLASEGVKSRGEIRRGDAAEIITKEAQSQGADLIVMGTAARTGMDAFWSGSVSPKVSERTHLPLLLIPVLEV